MLKDAIKNKMVSVNTLNSMGKLMANAGRLADLEGLIFPLYNELQIKKDEFTYENLLCLLHEERRILDIYRVWDVIVEKEKLAPSFESICYYLECAILEANENKVIEAFDWFKKLNRIPKNKYLKYLGEQESLPVRLHAYLHEFENKYGLVRDKKLKS